MQDNTQIETFLSNFCKVILPECFSSTLVFTLGAFVAAPKLKTLCLGEPIAHIVKLTHKCLSKYTHKDMDELRSTPEFNTLFSYFRENGMEFMESETIVQNARTHYQAALEEISTQPSELPIGQILNLDFLD